MVQYARPRLLTADDKRYRAFVEQFKLQRSNQRAIRPPRNRDLFGGEAEAALRNLLGADLPLAETRILEYEERRGRRATTKYRELDALAIERDRAHVFEIKASRTASSLRRAIGQLEETRAILRLLYRRVAVSILLVDTGIPADAAAVAALMASENPPPRPPEALDAVLASLPNLQRVDDPHQALEAPQIGLRCYTVEEIIALAGAENLHLDWSQDDLPDEQVAPPRSDGPVYRSDEHAPAEANDDDEDNPLAAALRRAGLK